MTAPDSVPLPGKVPTVLTCAACGRDNRGAGKFCKACGGRLVPEIAHAAGRRKASDDPHEATVQAFLAEALRADEVDEPTVIVPAPTRARPVTSRPASLGTATAAVPSRPRRIRDARRRAGRWTLLGIVLLAVAAGGGYAYRSAGSKSKAGPDATSVTTPPAATTMPAAPTPTAAAPAAVSATRASAAPSPVAPLPEPVLAPSRVTSPAPLPPPARKPRKAASAPAPAPVSAVTNAVPQPAPEATQPVAAAAAPSPAALPAPQSACAGRGFIGTAQCMVAQCARPEFAAHAQCEPVRRQQRIDEEKRNPLNAG